MGYNIKTTMGRLPKTAKMYERCWRVTITAENEETQKLLSNLHCEAINGNLGYWLRRMESARKRDKATKLS